MSSPPFDTGGPEHTPNQKPTKKEFDSAVMRARLVLILWVFISEFVFGLVYVSVITEGLVYLIPTLAQRIYKAVPFLLWMGEYQATYKLTLAFVFAIATFATVVWLWNKVLTLWLHGDCVDQPEPVHFRARQEFLFGVLAFVAITADAILFYISLCVSGWGSSFFSLSGLLATAIYIVVLLYITIKTIELRRQLDREKEKAVWSQNVY